LEDSGITQQLQTQTPQELSQLLAPP
jgi:hypothetical protein